MQASWSLILNILLLLGVIVAIARIITARRQQNQASSRQPSAWPVDKANDDAIISIRKVTQDLPPTADRGLRDNRPVTATKPVISIPRRAEATPTDTEGLRSNDKLSSRPLSTVRDLGEKQVAEPRQPDKAKPSVTPMFFLLAKDKRQFAGYELLQTLLGIGLRFGDGQLFHRHQQTNGHGPVLFSLAAATEKGVFDLQNIGAFSVHGLCLFMQASGHDAIDGERFDIMLETAKQLSEELDAHLLDDKRQPLSELSLKRYYAMLNLNPELEEI